MDNKSKSLGFFISGTGTEVGKTYVGALIAAALAARGVRVGVYKPVASGCSSGQEGGAVADDARRLWEAAGRPGNLADVCPQAFATPIAPHLSAHAEGKSVDRDLLRQGVEIWRQQSEIVLVEGAGGLMSPLSDVDYNADLAADLGYPLLIVAPNRLGVINDTLQTLITATTFRDGLDVAGVILNRINPGGDASCASNRQELQSRCVPPVLGEVMWQEAQWESQIDWLALARQHAD